MNEKDKNRLTPLQGKKEKKETFPPKRKGSAFNENPVGHKEAGQRMTSPPMNEEEPDRLKDSNR